MICYKGAFRCIHLKRRKDALCKRRGKKVTSVTDDTRQQTRAFRTGFGVRQPGFKFQSPPLISEPSFFKPTEWL